MVPKPSLLNSGAELKNEIAYREYKDGMAQLAFYQDLTYDLSDTKIIGFRDILIEVIEATNTNIEFIVKSKK